MANEYNISHIMSYKEKLSDKILCGDCPCGLPCKAYKDAEKAFKDSLHYENTQTRGCYAGFLHGDQTLQKCVNCKFFPCQFLKGDQIE